MAELKIKIDGVWQPALPVGTPGSPGPPGAPGPLGPPGADGLAGGAIPAGGVAADYLVKAPGGDFDTAWETPVHTHTGRILHKIFQGPWDGTPWSSFVVTLEARPYLMLFNAAGHASANGMRDVYIQMDGVLKANSRLYQNVTAQHQTFHTATTILTGITAGEHVFTVHNGGSVVSDGNDFGMILLYPL